MQMTVQLRLTYRFIYIALFANLSKVTPAVGKQQIARLQQLSFDIAVFNQQSRYTLLWTSFMMQSASKRPSGHFSSGFLAWQAQKPLKHKNQHV